MGLLSAIDYSQFTSQVAATGLLLQQRWWRRIASALQRSSLQTYGSLLSRLHKRSRFFRCGNRWFVGEALDFAVCALAARVVCFSALLQGWLERSNRYEFPETTKR